MGASGVKHVSQLLAKSYEIDEGRQEVRGLLLWAPGRVWGTDGKRFFVALGIRHDWLGELRPPKFSYSSVCSDLAELSPTAAGEAVWRGGSQ